MEWFEVEALFRGLTEAGVGPNVSSASHILPHPPARQFVRKLMHRLPVQLRVPVVDALVAQEFALRAWLRLLKVLARGAIGIPFWLAQRLRRQNVRPKKGAADHQSVAPSACFASSAAPGDLLLVVGAPWSHPDYASLIGKHREQLGLRFALLVYDLIPLRHPEWCDRGLVRLFRSWFESVFPLCDHLFAISQSTAADVETYALQRGIALSGPVRPIPIGTGFGAAHAAAVARRTNRLPPPASYALVVSTIEARKNHLLLFRVWRRLLAELPRDGVPTLVFAGRIGWLVEDLICQIANTNNLDGKLLIIENPTDEELVALYRSCLFTLLPSFYEGWGLSVTESLAFGKPCLISDRTSLPEAGGELAHSFDPDNLHDAYGTIRSTIEDRAALARWEAKVQREFKPVPWSATVEALLSGMGHPLVAVSDATV